MYIWKTSKLSVDIKNSSVTEVDWKNYFLWLSIIMTISVYLVMLMPRTNMTAIMVEIVAIIAILVFGINITFDTNKSGGGNGVNYISRVTALSLPITVKIFVLSFVFGIAMAAAVEMMSLSKDTEEWIFSIFTIIVQVVFFWRINSHLKFIVSV